MPFRRGNRKGPGGGRSGGRFGGGRGSGRRQGGEPPAECICPACGRVVPHTPGIPCFKVQCSECGTPMMARFRDEL